MVSLVRQGDRDFQTYRIPIADIRDYLGLRTNKLYDDIKRVADSLLSRVLHIPEEDGGWLKVGWVTSARYIPKGAKGAEMACLELCFSPEIKPYLLELKAHFANFMLQNVAGLRSFYSIRLYELLNSRRRLKIAVFDVAALRTILKVETKYANYKDLRARVILTAQAELAGKTDLAFDFAETRRGRKVVSVTFHIRDNVPAKPPHTLTGAHSSPRPVEDRHQPVLFPTTKAERDHERLTADAIAEGVQNGVREPVMRDLLATREPRHVLENIELARKRHMAAGGWEGVNLAGLTVAAVTNDYAAEGRAGRERTMVRAQAREHVKAARSAVAEIEATARKARARDLKSRLDALPAAERKALQATFAENVTAGRHGEMLAVAFLRKRWAAGGIEAIFHIFAAPRLGIGGENDYCRAEAEQRGIDWDMLAAAASKS